ncbi:hypothetical protein [Scytonema sp. PCC 10023]|uniref:hypothetical protein n=1 Tax=Scytonema sp. PCC 10023 TaxID=1680591 RepID=UPI0039C60CAA
MPRVKKTTQQPSSEQLVVVDTSSEAELLSPATQVPETQEANAESVLQTEEMQIATVESELVLHEESSEPLTDEERTLLDDLEQQVEESFYIAAKALWVINKRRLYRETHQTFEDYCRDRFQFTPRHLYYQIKAAEVIENLQQSERAVQILPSSEYQVRPLSRLKKPEQQVAAWKKSVEKAGGQAPSHEIVKQAVTELFAVAPPKKEELSPRIVPGDICLIKRSSDERLTGRVGYWAVVQEVTNSSCTIQLYDRTVSDVSANALSPFGYTTKDAEAMQKLCKRLRTIYNSRNDLEEVAIITLEYFGKLKRPTLSSLEKKMLTTLESEALKTITKNLTRV